MLSILGHYCKKWKNLYLRSVKTTSDSVGSYSDNDMVMVYERKFRPCGTTVSVVSQESVLVMASRSRSRFVLYHRSLFQLPDSCCRICTLPWLLSSERNGSDRIQISNGLFLTKTFADGVKTLLVSSF